MSEEKKSKIFQKLAGSRRALLSTFDELEESQWAASVYSEDTEWSIKDLLGHLVDSERGMTRLIEVIKDGGEGVSADFDLNRWNARAVSKSSDMPPAELRQEMTTNRANLLKLLNSLSDADWEKKGRHGSLQIMSIEEILTLIADHEIRHLEDINRILEED